MSKVYIKDFVMPESCAECKLHHIWEYDNETSCRLKFGLWQNMNKKERHPDCPLREVKR